MGNTSGGTQLVNVYNSDGQHIYDIEWLPDASGFLFSEFYVDLEHLSDIFEYDFATQEITPLTSSLRDDIDPGGAHALSISPDGQQIVFERVADSFYDTTSSLRIMNRDGSDLHKLADDAGRPAWGQTAPPLTPRAYLPIVVR